MDARDVIENKKVDLRKRSKRQDAKVKDKESKRNVEEVKLKKKKNKDLIEREKQNIDIRDEKKKERSRLKNKLRNQKKKDKNKVLKPYLRKIPESCRLLLGDGYVLVAPVVPLHGFSKILLWGHTLLEILI